MAQLGMLKDELSKSKKEADVLRSQIANGPARPVENALSAPRAATENPQTVTEIKEVIKYVDNPDCNSCADLKAQRAALQEQLDGQTEHYESQRTQQESAFLQEKTALQVTIE